jgi:lincosamide nucleotidyltransferase A/C/D/E
VALLDPVYLQLTRSHVGGLLRSPPLRWLRRLMIPGMGATDVVDVLELLDHAGISCWLVGGWGVDALVGRQTRKHLDVDVALEGQFLEQALNSLESAGFVAVQREGFPARTPAMVILRDKPRRRVELMPVDISAPPPGENGRREASRFRYAADSITTGTVNGRTVACLAAPVQLMLRTSYTPRDSDRHDVRVLMEHYRLDVPQGWS